MAVTRRVLLAGLAGVPIAASAQDVPPFAYLRETETVRLTESQLAQRFTASPAPSGPPGRWEALAPLPLPRSEMAWATAAQGRMHMIGGYGDGQVNRPYHHVYDPAEDVWRNAAPLPLGANHVAVAASEDTVYAFGGFVQQNRDPHRETFAYDIAGDSWRSLAPLPRARGAAGLALVDGRLHMIGGAEGIEDRRSVAWHEVYDIAADRWETLPDMPGFPLDHKGVVVVDGRIHVIGGRINTFATNVGHHHAFVPATGQWEERTPMPTPRSGHGAVLLRGRIWCMGGEETNKVFGQLESYDPATDGWTSHAPMLTPRHGLGAAVLGDRIHVAGGGAVTGGSIQSSIHEAFTPA
ncbi:Kelch repeat-containing protein [Marinivivus vitaminiproducens]|uniref:Kelch repeat-containing protein n=1 Tax=Marinivivus vitaminiproducens TaxID=3035935 RepID=UPI00279E9B7E|nr:kelch repeat-containing protein [Geminicoccaceae bacterium SCSIO 64248]